MRNGTSEYVKQLQTYLYCISLKNSAIPQTAADGIYRRFGVSEIPRAAGNRHSRSGDVRRDQV